jgi:hypothetical protein
MTPLAHDRYCEAIDEWLGIIQFVQRTRPHDAAAAELRGPLTDVLLTFYRRLPLDDARLEVLGERELLDFWLERATFG